MNTTSGIVFEKDLDTQKRYVRIDFDLYGKAMIPFLEQIGVVDRNDDFWEEYANAITGDELRQRMYQRIDTWKGTTNNYKAPCQDEAPPRPGYCTAFAFGMPVAGRICLIKI